MITPEALFSRIQREITDKQIYLPEYFDVEEFEEIFANLFGENGDNNDLYKIDFGASKGVIVPIDGDFVFKVGFAGEYDDCSNNGDFIFYPWNWCELENTIYQHALEVRADRYFAQTKFFKKLEFYNEYLNVYIQTKVVPLHVYHPDHYHYEGEYESKVIRNFRCFDRIDLMWIRDFIDTYGLAGLEELGCFADEEDVNDLHSDNIGYYNGYPVIFDFSGYSSSSEWYS